jgi:hypothetical protein
MARRRLAPVALLALAGLVLLSVAAGQPAQIPEVGNGRAEHDSSDRS